MSRVTRAEIALGASPIVDVEPEIPVTEVAPPAPAKGKAGKPTTDPDPEEL